jgi:hypothetical protein
MLGSIRLENVPAQTGKLQVLQDSSLLLEINSGIYSEFIDSDAPMVTLEVPGQGFRLNYPAALVQYMQNYIMSDYYFNSFKINPDEIFSISVEPASSSGTSASDKAAAIKKQLGPSFKLLAEGVSALEGRQFVYFTGTITEKWNTRYIQKFIAENNGRLYMLQLESNKRNPSFNALYTFSIIFSTFEFTPVQQKKSPVLPHNSTVFYDKLSGLSFNYPDNWRLTNNVPATGTTTAGITGNAITAALAANTASLDLKLNLPDISDFINIYISENNVRTAPHEGLPSVMLFTGTRQEGRVSYTGRLANYMDQNGKGRLCSSVTITSADKTYTMYIVVNSVWASEGRISDPEIAAAVNEIAGSLRLEDDSGKIPAAPAGTFTPENNERRGIDAAPHQKAPHSGYVKTCS